MAEKTVVISGESYRLKYGLKSHFLFESYSEGKPFRADSASDLIMLLYCSLYGYNPTFRMTVDDFIEVLDDMPELLADFVEVINEKARLDQQKAVDSKKKMMANL